MTDALSMKFTVRLVALGVSQPQLIMEFGRLKLEVIKEGTPALTFSMIVQPKWLERNTYRLTLSSE